MMTTRSEELDRASVADASIAGADVVRAKVLLVDDDEPLLRGLSFTLVDAGYEVTTTLTPESALAAVRTGAFDVIVLNPQMGAVARSDLPKAFCDAGAGAVIVVSTVGAAEAKIAALDCGAEDYLVKPVDLDELVARIRVVLRRRTISTPTERMVVDLAARRVSVDGKARSLSRHEADLLRVLLEAKGAPVEAEAICRAIWSEASDSAMAKMRVLVWQTRRKLEPEPRAPEFILSVPPKNYRLNVGAVRLA